VGHLEYAISKGATAWIDHHRQHSLSANELLCWALLLAVSNHLPASLLSPELFLLERSFGEVMDGGFALSLAGLGELSAVGWR
jgi:hypothetical protein